MYIPGHFEQNDLQVMCALIRRHPLATLVTSTEHGLSVNHIPLVLAPDSGDRAENLRLHGHIARANPLAKTPLIDDAIAIFQGPNAYISPSWYATKQQHGKVVPTWNYTAVHLSGRVRLIDDPDWTLAMVEQLTDQEEAGRPDPWSVQDAPTIFTEGLLKSIVGLELTVSEVRGKWKVSQNQPDENREGVRDGLKGDSNPAADRLSGFQS